MTILFCDLTGSTALGESIDPERLRAVLARYFDRMKAIVERHGGSVEKFIGDAVMAVFGVPELHEDDALRAVRAADEMRAALPELGLQGRIGVMTGPVVTGTEERLATGDAVNVAARLEQAAPPGEVLIGRSTLDLVRDATDTEPLEPLELKGKADRVPAYRLLAVRDAPDRRLGGRFVGRTRELDVLSTAWERARDGPRCELFTIVGEAGVGKSRLVAELLASIPARVARGRCLPYGEGITYWPVVEVVKQLRLMPADEAAAASVRSLLGESDATTSPEEIAWAFRKTLEAAAEGGPIVLVFDDIQWADEAFLDLVEHVALLSSGAPILLLCMARPELTEQRPSWPVTLRLEPLGDREVEELLHGRIPSALGGTIARAAGGNPLFLEEMVAMAEETDGEVVVPPSLRALLAARLDRLDEAERRVLERCAIEGEVFHRGAVQALTPEEPRVTSRLAALVRRELIRPETPIIAGEDGFRFRHLLIRDAAYDALPKAVRSELHERFATWLDGHGGAIVELDELLGYHLERACRYRDELGLATDESVTADARRHLLAAGHRAVARSDYRAAAGLLERAAALSSPTEPDLAFEMVLGDALVWSGRGEEAVRRADALAAKSSAADDRVGELCGRIQGAVHRQTEEASKELPALLDEALPVFEAEGNDAALYLAYSAVAVAEDVRGQMRAALAADERAVFHAGRAGLPQPGPGFVAYCHFVGPTPVPELLAWLDEHAPLSGGDQFGAAYRANALAMLGRFDEARGILVGARAQARDRGGGLLLANLTAFESAWVERWAGDPAAAAEFGFEGFRLHEDLGEPGWLAWSAMTLAESLYQAGRVDEAEAWAARAAGSRVGDVSEEILWRQVTAKVLASRGEFDEAERLARESISIVEGTDMLDRQGDAHAALAEVLTLAGRTGEAAAALEDALARYERKGNVVMAARARERLRKGLRGA